MVPSSLCPPQMVTAPSCPSLLGSWVLLWRSPPPWRSLPRTTALRRKARSWPGLHLQGTWLPQLSVVQGKRLRLWPLQRRRRAPPMQRPSLSPAGSRSTPWRAGGSPLPPKPQLLRHKQWAPVLPPPPNPTLSLSPLMAPPQPSPSSPRSPPPPLKPKAKLLLLLQLQKVQPPLKDPPQGKTKRMMVLLLFKNIALNIILFF